MKKLPWLAIVRGPGPGRAVCTDALTAIEQRLAASSTARMVRSFPETEASLPRMVRISSAPVTAQPTSRERVVDAGSCPLKLPLGIRFGEPELEEWALIGCCKPAPQTQRSTSLIRIRYIMEYLYP